MNSSIERPTFSVVIPTYNRADTLSAAIESVLVQGVRETEIIVVDDGSEDSTEQLVKRFKSGNITYCRCEHFGGPARARNIGVRLAKGDWICFLDSDDRWYPKKLVRIAEVIQTEEVDLIYHPMDIVKWPSFRKLGRTPVRALRKPVLKSILLDQHRWVIPNSSVVIRKRLLEKIDYISEDPELIALEDFDTWTRVAEFTDRFRLVAEPLAAYSIGTGNLTSYDASRVAALQKIVSARMSSRAWSGTARDRSKVMAYINYRYGRSHQHNGAFDKARMFYLASLREGGRWDVSFLAFSGLIASALRMRI